MADKWVRLKSNGNILYPRTQSTLLQWGGPNIFASVSPLDAALSDELSANRFAEMPTANFVFEQSSNAGSSWTTYDADGYSLVTASTSTVRNTNIVGNQSASNWHRFTIDVRPGSSNNFYGQIRKFLFLINTAGATGCRVKIEGSTFATPDTFVQIADAPIDGWSGWNVINVSITAGLGTESFYKKLRFTFSQTGVNSNYASCLYVDKMRVYCANCWDAPGNFALWNRTYYLLNGEQRQQYSIRFGAGKKLYGIATNADLANNSLRLGDQLPAYYLNYQNLSNKPTSKIVAGPTSIATDSSPTSNPYINTVFDGAAAAGIRLYSSDFGITAESNGQVSFAIVKAPTIFAADSNIATTPGFSTNPYLRIAYGNVYATGPRLKSGNGIQIQSDTSDNITITSTLDGIINLSKPSYTLYTLSTGIYRVGSSVTKLYYNGVSDTSVYISLNLTQPAYLVVTHTKGGCEWVLYYQKTSGVIPSILWGYGSSSTGYYFENSMPEKSGTILAGYADTTVLGGIKLGYINTDSKRAVILDSNYKAYTDVGVNVNYSALGSVFGSGTGGMVRINDTANNNRYLFIFGETGAMSDGASSTWNYPSAITQVSPSIINFSFTEVANVSPAQWQNAVIITSKSTTACTIRNNCSVTCKFSFVGMARW